LVILFYVKLISGLIFKIKKNSQAKFNFSSSLDLKCLFVCKVLKLNSLMHKLDFKKESNQLILPPAKIRLFVQDVIDFSSQYGKENSSSYTVSNIRSRPHYFPKYGDFLGKMIKSLI